MPFVGVHGGFLTGIDAETYLKSSDEIVKGVSKAIEEYNQKAKEYFQSLEVENQHLLFFHITNTIFQNYFKYIFFLNF